MTHLKLTTKPYILPKYTLYFGGTLITMITSSKRIVTTGDTISVTDHFEKVTGRTRAGKNGKLVRCPVCEHTRKVYNFSFSSLTCPHCKTCVNKEDWLVDQLDTWRTPR